MQKVILWGTGELTQIIEYYINKEKSFEICAYTMDKEYINEDTFNSKPVIPFEEIENYYSPAEYRMALPMSPKHLNKIREEKYNKAKEKGYSFVNFISKDAVCDASNIGKNVFILPGCVINPFSEIGNNVIIWANSHIGHHSKIHDNCFCAVVNISGHCDIGNNCFLGTNSTFKDNIKIGAYSIIGAGAVVTKNVKEASVLAVKQTPKLEITSYEAEGLIQ